MRSMKCPRPARATNVAAQRMILATLAGMLAFNGAQAQGNRARTRDVVVAPGVTLRVIEGGSTRAKSAPVVLIPGWSSDAGIWRDVAAALGATRRVVSFDPRSQGRSTITTHGNTPEQRALDLRALLSAVRVERPVLVAWSQGVQDAAAFISAFGDTSISTLVLVDSPMSDGAAGVTARPAEAEALFRRLSIYEAYQREYLDGMYKVIIHRISEGGRSALVEGGMRTPTSIGIAQLMADFFGPDRTTVLEKITVPTLVVASAESPEIERQRQMAARIRNARFEVIPDAGHAVFIDQPARFTALLTGFLP